MNPIVEDFEHPEFLDILEHPGNVIASIKNIATHSVLVVSVVASAILAFKNPKVWVIASLAVNVVNLYAIPKVLRYGNAMMIKTALALNLVATGSLMLGGVIICCHSLSTSALANLRNFELGKVLLEGFLITGLIGYGVPCFKEALARAHEILNCAAWEERFEYLQTKFNEMPAIGLGLLQANLLPSIMIQLTLLAPKFVLKCFNLFRIPPPDYIWMIAVSVLGNITLDNFEQELQSLIEIGNLQRLEMDLDEDAPLPQGLQTDFIQQITSLLKSLKDEDLERGVEKLIARTGQLYPAILSPNRFFELFQGDTLTATEDVCQRFIDLADNWNAFLADYWALVLEMTFFDFKLKEPVQEKPEKLSEIYQEIRKKFFKIRSKIDEIYRFKRMWGDFADLGQHGQQLPFAKGDSLLAYLQDKKLMDAIDGVYQSLYGSLGKENGANLSDKLTLLSIKTGSSQDTPADEETALVYIFAAQHRFIAQDFFDLQEWLDADSPHQIENKLADIGLKTAEDLYEKEILVHGEELDKEQIRSNLQHYITNCEKNQNVDQRAVLTKPEEVLEEHPVIELDPIAQDPPHPMWKKTKEVVFNLINGGLIVVPVIIFPQAGSAGLLIGTCFFTLKRFEFYGTEPVVEAVNGLLEATPFGEVMQNLLNRPIFTLNAHARQQRKRFVEEDFYSRMRIINFQMLLSLFVANFRFGYENIGVGSFCQGIAISRQVVELF